MAISIENTIVSTIDLLREEGGFLKVFAFPGDARVRIPAGQQELLVRTPHIEFSDNEAVVTRNGARTQIPASEAVGKGLDAYIIDSLAEGKGGKVNGDAIEAGSQSDDGGILFIAT